MNNTLDMCYGYSSYMAISIIISINSYLSFSLSGWPIEAPGGRVRELMGVKSWGAEGPLFVASRRTEGRYQAIIIENRSPRTSSEIKTVSA